MPDRDMSFAVLPSLGVLTRQVHTLLQRLEEITEQEYPQQACDLRDVFLAIARRADRQLTHIPQIADPSERAWRLRLLAKAVQAVFAHLRYLQSSAPRQTPPGIQIALTELVDRHFPKTPNGLPACVIRPQWTYNFKCVHLNGLLAPVLNPSVFDLEVPIDNGGVDYVLDELWKLEFPNRARPQQLGVLSFAGLDVEDSLSLALLAHELSHFIDFSYTRWVFPDGFRPEAPPLFMRGPLAAVGRRIRDEVQAAFQMRGQVVDEYEIRRRSEVLSQQVGVCLRELLADVMAVRMLGFAFFAAEASFLVGITESWPEPVILQDGFSPGYPGADFRLAVAFEHLNEPEGGLGFRSFLEAHQSGVASKHVEGLLSFLDAWDDRLRNGLVPAPELSGNGPVGQDLRIVPERVVKAVRREIVEAARGAVPNERCARLTPHFFERIDRLSNLLPPILGGDKEGDSSFHEIMSAGWAYQVIAGERREWRTHDSRERTEVRDRTCRLLRKAIELIPLARMERNRT